MSTTRDRVLPTVAAAGPHRPPGSGRRPAYDDIAGRYSEMVQTGPFHRLVLPCLLDVVGNPRDQRVCDVGCGEGVVARELARRGARVVGIDLSGRLLAWARQHERTEPRGIAYIREDAQTLAAIKEASFDGAVCNLALMDILDLTGTLRVIQRVLRPDGWFVFAIDHPCFFAPESAWVAHPDGTASRQAGHYFADGFQHPPGAPGVRGRVGFHHRALGTYLNALARTGFMIERVDEPRASGEIADRLPPGFREVPAVLAARCRSRVT